MFVSILTFLTILIFLCRCMPMRLLYIKRARLSIPPAATLSASFVVSFTELFASLTIFFMARLQDLSCLSACLSVRSGSRLSAGNLKHLPFFGVGERWETYEARFEESLEWLRVRERSFFFFPSVCECVVLMSVSGFERLLFCDLSVFRVEACSLWLGRRFL